MVSLKRASAWSALGGFMWLSACGATPPFQLSGYHQDDHFSWQTAGRVPVLVVNCPSGIGSVTLVDSGRDISALLVELHLRGLEEFAVTGNQARYRLEATRAGSVILEPTINNPLALMEAAAEVPNSPWRVRVDLRPFLDDSKRITLSWVDFHR